MDTSGTADAIVVREDVVWISDMFVLYNGVVMIRYLAYRLGSNSAI